MTTTAKMRWWRGMDASRLAGRPEPAVRSRGLVRRRAPRTAVVVGLAVLILGLTASTAAASGAGKVTNYTGTGRITTAGVVTIYTRHRRQRARRDRRRA